VAFELYGGGTFGWTLIGEEGVVQQGAGFGEVAVSNLAPGEYTLDVDHACLQEFVEFDAIDPDAPVMDCSWNEVAVADENGAATLSAIFLGVADAYAWYYNGELIGEDVPLNLEVLGLGEYEVTLVADRGNCSTDLVLSFTVASVERGVEASAFTVMTNPGGWWELQSDQIWTGLNWELFDAAGRQVDAGQSGEGQSFVVQHPFAAGVYSLRIDRVGVDVEVLSLHSVKR